MHEIEKDGIVISDTYAAYLPEHGIAIVSDLHIGYEGVLQREGVMIPKYQKKILKERIEKIIEKFEPELLVINGDFKHEFGKNLRQEWNEAMELLEFIKNKTNVLLVRGNHDNFLKTIASKASVRVVEHYRAGDITIFHGHKDMEGKKKIIGHEHPSISLRDAVGAMVKLPCFLISDSITVLPALSPLASGTDVSTADKEEYLSPVLKKEDIEDLEIYAIADSLLFFSTVGKIKRL
ncbi:MAG: metallophosphoesterase [Thermoplasmata archaeon]|nr:metallophosphoesterase [Thermoplasmata archaeon]